jgi:single-strand DNA-binding protein
MEQLNRIELIGVVGRDAKITTVGDSAVAHFSMATNYAYKDKDGNAVVETTWHNVRAWKGRKMPALEDIKKGTWLHVTGRTRNIRYTAADGSERTSFEVLAGEITIVDPKKEG